ncbi:MAG: PQQ-binding-like beta-propeller repeat protein, partial [Candidatus Nanohaloarchaea archaeon]|nr:PQQ-binding-like beta-propeller repeat protein [Candidatus Nanohaloarchaea archaeon]
TAVLFISAALAGVFTVDTGAEWDEGNFSGTTEVFGELRLDFRVGKVRQHWKFTRPTTSVSGISVGPNGSFAYSGASSVRKIWGINGSETWNFTGHADSVNSVSVSPNGDFVYSGSDDDTVRKLWVANGSVVWNFTGHTSWVNAVSAGPNGSFVYSGGSDNVVRKLWAANGSWVWNFTTSSGVGDVSAGPDGNFVYSNGDTNGGIRKLWAANGSWIWNFTGHTSTINEISAGPAGDFVYSSGDDEVVRKLWSPNGSWVWNFTKLTNNALGVSAGPSGDFVYVSEGGFSGQNTARKLWADNGSEVWVFNRSTDRVKTISSGPNGHYIYIGTANNNVRQISNRYGEFGSYVSKVFDPGSTSKWENLTVDINLSRAVGEKANATVEISDSSDFSSLKGSQNINLSNGTVTYNLSLQNSRYARVNFSLFSGNENRTPRVRDFEIVFSKVPLTSDSGPGEWRMFHRYLNHTGFINTTGPMIGGGNTTTFRTGDTIQESSPAVVNGFVYVGSNDNSVYQLNASNVSQMIANFSTGGDVKSSPAVANGYVYVGSQDNNLYQLNASNVSDRIAEFATGDNIEYSSPSVYNGYVYFGSFYKRIYQLNASNVSDMEANFSTGSSIFSSPAVANGYVYIGSDDKKVYQLNASNVSQKISSFKTGDWVRSSPAVANGYVYVGSFDNSVYQLNASNVSDMEANFSTGNIVISSPAVTGNSVYTGDAGGNVYQLNASNVSDKFGELNIGSQLRSSPTVLDGFVYIGSYDNNLYKLGEDTDPPNPRIINPPNATTSDFEPWLNVTADEPIDVWRYNVDSNDNSSFQPNITISALSDGKHNVTVWGNDTSGNYNRSIVWFRVDSDVPENVSFVPPTPTSGTTLNTRHLKLKAELRDAKNITIRLYNSSTLIASRDTNSSVGVLFTPEKGEKYFFNATGWKNSGEKSVTETRNITVSNSFLSSQSAIDEWRMFQKNLNFSGKTGSKAPENISNTNVSTFTTGNDVTSSPAVVDGSVYVGSEDNYVYQLNASNISEKFAKFLTGGDVVSAPAVTGNNVYVGSKDNNLYQLNASNVSEKLAKFDTGGSIWRHPTVNEGYVYIGGGNETLYQLKSSNISNKFAEFDAGAWMDSAPAVDNGYVYIGDDGGDVHQLNASDVSKEVATFSGGHINSPPTVTENFVYVLDSTTGGNTNKAYQLNASNVSDKLATFSLSSTTVYAWASFSVWNDSVYVPDSDEHIYQLNSSNISDKLDEFYISGGTTDSAPAVANGSIYFHGGSSNVYQLDANNISNKIGSYGVGSYSWSSPAVANGFMYIGSGDNNLYQFGNYNPTDVEGPEISFVSPTPENGTKEFVRDFEVNVSASDSSGVLNVTIRVYNSSSSLVRSETHTSRPFLSNFSLKEGNYKYNATAYDSKDQSNSTNTRHLTIDVFNSDSRSTSEWRMFHRYLNHTG